MSCHHQHHSHQHHDGPPIPTNASQSLLCQIDLLNLSALNIKQPNDKIKLIFQKSANDDPHSKYNISEYVSSDLDSQIILKIPFNANVKLFSIILRTNGSSKKCPKTIKFFKNRLDLDFDTIDNVKPLYEVTHPLLGYLDNNLNADEAIDENDLTFVEHYLSRRLFTGLTHLTIYFQNSYSDNDDSDSTSNLESDSQDSDSDDEEDLTMYYIELRGDSTALTKNPVITIYEAAANPTDHKAFIKDTKFNSQSNY
ncbi:PITH domain-containing protein [Ascoidea rubescens DSM 1968]|uniref:DUF1000-domain-containing protein n=1 Tax=Ascoidea rubescens DSM 1968 TaxID=1344418 RepID=A0A1D2VN24_9ASCO|nr:DUF1000-domain-containing protein [Ascoidea rubescens DSM 1968]ODV62984.1 DUF1000-domain-containing protein [Ascoidea rubescens DSM 1968]